MSESLRCVPPNSVLTGWDFSTGSVKCLAFELDGTVIAEVRLPTDLWFGTREQIRRDDPAVRGLSELNLMQLEGQARATVRAIAGRLKDLGRLDDWIAGGISATHHTAGRIDADCNQVRRAICWNDHTLAEAHRVGQRRLGGQKKVHELLGGPWASRYSLSHLVKDETKLDPADWKRTSRILPHGALAAGYLTGRFDVVSISAAASMGLLHFGRRKWAPKMLGAIKDPSLRKLARKQLPELIEHTEPIGPLSESMAKEGRLAPGLRPLIFPTSDDQQAGLVGGGAVESGQMAVILGNSAVVNSSSADLPQRGQLDVMCLNWGPYLWMRCYNNGAQFLDQVLGENPDWKSLEAAARKQKPGAGGAAILPFVSPEPSLKVNEVPGDLLWVDGEPRSPGKRYRASLEAIAYLIALGVREHEKAGVKIDRITVSGGIARSDLMCEILASVLGRSIERLESDEGPALGAAVTALASLETHLRRLRSMPAEFTVADAVAKMVRFADPVEPRADWIDDYRDGLKTFEQRIKSL